jgi:UDP-N-acetylglucosamine 2-epimerase (non-hydrolysing)
MTRFESLVQRMNDADVSDILAAVPTGSWEVRGGGERPVVMVCFGTRPEVIKLAPVVDALTADDDVDVMVVTTAQHRQLIDQMLETFDIEPDLDLDLMTPNQTLAELTASAVARLGEVMAEHRPDAVLVQGDTTTMFCAALAGFYEGIPVGHVEAGLRTNDPRRPFPEEINRRLASTLATWHYCPTERNAFALRREGVEPHAICITGNTVIDALLAVDERPLTPEQAARLPAESGRPRILVTLHRRETQGDAQRRLCRMLGSLADERDVEILLPMHLSPAVRSSVIAELGGSENVHLMEPLDYRVFVHAMRTSRLIVTDSGGIQEEGPVFGVPVVVMRDTTERVEAVDAGCLVLSGTDPAGVKADILELLDDQDRWQRMSEARSPYGDGRAADRIVAHLRDELDGRARAELVGEP